MADNSNKNTEKNKAVKEDLGEDELQPNAVEPESPDGEEETPESLADKLARTEKDYLYMRAELENLKRQSFKERSQLLKYGCERLARDLLDTLDVFKSALSTEVSEETYQEFVKGIELTAQSLKATLEKHGILEMDCIGQPFDPATQEALSSEVNENFPEGHVSQVFKAPYKYHDKLLRPGQVVVTRAKTE